MGASFGGSIKLSGESEYKKALKEINANLKSLSSELKLTTTEFVNGEKSVQETKGTYSDLNYEIKKQRDNINTLRNALSQAEKEYGANSDQVRDFKTQLNNAEAKLSDMEKQTSKTTDELEDMRDSTDDAGKSAVKFGDLLKANLLSDAIMSGIKALGGAIKQVGSALIDIGKNAIESYADFEQLVGGVETLFGESSKTVQKYANDAYKTAGLSANEYMETVTSFSASLLQSLNGDTAKAAEVANMALIDMADNANKMGTDMQSIQNAYQGFAKQNYTMLDNLKIGYGGTKQEMQRLLADAQKISGVKYDISNLNDVYQAIHVIQTELGITGTTAKEASSTISGSISAMKSAWQNMLTGIANDDADFEQLVNNLVDSAKTVAENLMPVVKVVIDRVGQLIGELPSKLVEYLPNILETGKELIQNIAKGITQSLPTLLSTGKEVLTSFIQGLISDLPNLVTTIIDLVLSIADTFVNNIDTIVDIGIQIIFALVDGLIQALPTLIEKVPELINNFWDAFDRNLWKIIQAGGELIIKLAKGLIDNIPVIISNAGEIIWAIVNTIMHIDMINVGKNLIANLGSGLKSMGGSIGNAAKELLNKLLHPFQSTMTFTEIGKNMISGIISGIKSMGSALVSAGKNAVSGLVSGIKGFLGIHSPSTLFRDEIGTNLALGLEEGFADTMDVVARDMQASIPTEFDTNINAKIGSINTNTGLSFADMVRAFKEAMKDTNIILDDEKVGKFVADTVEGVVYG